MEMSRASRSAVSENRERRSRSGSRRYRRRRRAARRRRADEFGQRVEPVKRRTAGLKLEAFSRFIGSRSRRRGDAGNQLARGKRPADAASRMAPRRKLAVLTSKIGGAIRPPRSSRSASPKKSIGGAVEGDLARAQHDGTIGPFGHQPDVVSDHQDRRAVALAQPRHQAHQLLRPLVVLADRRLVEDSSFGSRTSIVATLRRRRSPRLRLKGERFR